jgi:hypothetical protein
LTINFSCLFYYHLSVGFLADAVDLLVSACIVCGQQAVCILVNV